MIRHIPLFARPASVRRAVEGMPTSTFILSILIVAGLASPARSQSLADTLADVKVKGAKAEKSSADARLLYFSPGLKLITIDSLTRAQYDQQSLATLLTQQVPVFVRSYGFNGLATLNFRGSSAAQSAVYWNGIPIQNAALGVADVSVLPVSLFSNINIAYGGSASLWGSGNIGGAVLLESPAPQFDSSLRRNGRLSLGAGSFGQYLASAQARLSSRRWDFSVSAFGQKANNNFSFHNDLGQEYINTNASLSSLAALALLSYRVTNADIVRLSYWQQHYDRHIPPAFFEASSLRHRVDKSYRLMLDWQHAARSSWYFKGAWFRDGLRYSDPSIGLLSSQSVRQFYGEVGWRALSSARHQLLIFLPAQMSVMPSFDRWRLQSRYALAGAYTYSSLNKALSGSLSGRIENIDGQWIILPGVNAGWQLSKWLLAKANVQRTYRAPTLNERYYDPGGNPNLLPEEGWTVDGGYVIDLNISRQLRFRQEVSAYSRVIDNWIIWFGGAIWTPHNIASVHSRGLEIDNKLTIPLRRAKVHLSATWSYTRATTLTSHLPGDGSIGRQIPYTPRFGAQANVGLTHPGYYLNLNYTYTGFRYINVDESGLLPSYNTFNAQLQVHFLRRSRLPLSLNVQANNLLNTRYTVVNARPMPGFNWLASLSVSL